jgi:hypothetical protein
MHRALGVTQKTAWFMDHRVRLAMKTGSFLKMNGEIEADETFICGLAKNMHRHIRERKSEELTALEKLRFSALSSAATKKRPVALRPCMFPMYAAKRWLPRSVLQSSPPPICIPTL